MVENGSISPQWHHTTCGQRGGRPGSNHGQTMADRKKEKMQGRQTVGERSGDSRKYCYYLYQYFARIVSNGKYMYHSIQVLLLGCGLTETPDLSAFSRLEILDLSENDITELHSFSFTTLWSLRLLNLTNNNLTFHNTKELNQVFQGLPNLQILWCVFVP